MNAKRLLNIVAGAVLMYSGSQQALGFYNPQTGRWLNRDPISERVSFEQYALLHKTADLPEEAPLGFNGSLFTDNNPVGHTDMDGCRMTPDGDITITDKNRRNPPGKMIVIKVPKCTILFVYGHNYVDNFTTRPEGLQWIWNIIPEDDANKACSYATVAGCSANLIPNEIPLPGLKYSDYDPGETGRIRFSAVLQMWDAFLNKYAPAAAKEICKNSKCECKEIVFAWRKVGGGLLDLSPRVQKRKCSELK